MVIGILCDTFKYSYNIEGGSISIGYLSYLQRYCNKPIIGENGKSFGRAIHISGYNECNSYEIKGG